MNPNEIKAHIDQMAPHVRERKTAKLLIGAIQQIEALRNLLREIRDWDVELLIKRGEYAIPIELRKEMARLLEEE